MKISQSGAAVFRPAPLFAEFVIANDNTTTGNPIRYTGRRFDAETGLYYYRARYYSPTLGRFLQTDPIGYGDNMNMYAYVNNDPLSFRDPSGMNCVGIGDPDEPGGGSFECDPPSPPPSEFQINSILTMGNMLDSMSRANTPTPSAPGKLNFSDSGNTCPASESESKAATAAGIAVDAAGAQGSTAAKIGGVENSSMGKFFGRAPLIFSALSSANNIVKNWGSSNNHAALVGGEVGSFGVGVGVTTAAEFVGGMVFGPVAAPAAGFIIGTYYVIKWQDETNNKITNIINKHTGGC